MASGAFHLDSSAGVAVNIHYEIPDIENLPLPGGLESGAESALHPHQHNSSWTRFQQPSSAAIICDREPPSPGTRSWVGRATGVTRLEIATASAHLARERAARARAEAQAQTLSDENRALRHLLEQRNTSAAAAEEPTADRTDEIGEQTEWAALAPAVLMRMFTLLSWPCAAPLSPATGLAVEPDETRLSAVDSSPPQLEPEPGQLPHAALVVQPPVEFMCPISATLLEDPVVTAAGHVYERASITRWLENHDTDPNTNTVLASTSLTEVIVLRNLVREWRQRHGAALVAMERCIARDQTLIKKK